MKLDDITSESFEDTITKLSFKFVKPFAVERAIVADLEFTNQLRIFLGETYSAPWFKHVSEPTGYLAQENCAVQKDHYYDRLVDWGMLSILIKNHTSVDLEERIPQTTGIDYEVALTVHDLNAQRLRDVYDHVLDLDISRTENAFNCIRRISRTDPLYAVDK